MIHFRTENYAKYVTFDAREFDFVASDNCFDLSCGEEKIIEIRREDITKDGKTIPVSVSDFSGLKILTAYDIR